MAAEYPNSVTRFGADVYQKVFLPTVIDGVLKRDATGLLSRFSAGGGGGARIEGKGIHWYIDNSNRASLGYADTATNYDLSHISSMLQQGVEVGINFDQLYARATVAGPELSEGGQEAAKYVNTLTKLTNDVVSTIKHGMSVLCLSQGNGVITAFPDDTGSIAVGATDTFTFADVNRLLVGQTYDKMASDGTTVEGTLQITAINSRYKEGVVTVKNVGAATATITSGGTMNYARSSVNSRGQGLELILAPTGNFPRSISSNTVVDRTLYPTSLVPVEVDAGNAEFSRLVLDDLYRRLIEESPMEEAQIDEAGNTVGYPYALIMWSGHLQSLAKEGRAEQRAYSNSNGAKVEDGTLYRQVYGPFEFFCNKLTNRTKIYAPYMADFRLFMDQPEVLSQSERGPFQRLTNTDTYEHIQRMDWQMYATKLNSSAIISNVVEGDLNYA